MLTKSFFTGVPFVLCSLLAPDNGAPAGGGSASSAETKPGEKPAAEKPAEPAKPADQKPAEATALPKPTVFQRAAAMLKDKAELLATISARDMAIAEKDKEIANLKSQLATANAQLKGMAELEATIDQIASRKAVDIAAAQGVPPVHTDPANPGATEEDEVKLAFETAALEPDPRKRGGLFKKASRLLESKASGLN